MSKNIVVRGAKMHNLKNIDVKIPREKLTVVTGVSGSGKSSLAFDTIYAEGQRRYVESLSTYARQFLKLQEKPDVDSIDGLSPAISIDQKSTTRNPRSTVGTVTEIYDYLRLLFAKVGTPINPQNGRKLEKQTPGQILDAIDKWEDGTKFMIMAPIVRGKKGEHAFALEKIKKAGFVRLRVDGTIVTINDEIELDPKKKHNIEIVVDRLVKKDYSKKFRELSDGNKIEEKNDERLRVIDSIETALKFGEGIILVHKPDLEENSDTMFSENLADPETGFSFPPLEPRIFSFNSPHGACEDCQGLGYRLSLNKRTSINPKLSIREGGILPWGSLGSNMLAWNLSLLEAIGKKYEFSVDRPIEEIKDEVLDKIFAGFGKEEFTVELRGAFKGETTQTKFTGITTQTEKRYNETESDWLRKKLGEFMIEKTCKTCAGARLNIYGRNVFIQDKNIAEICNMSISSLKKWTEKLKVSEENKNIITPIKKEVTERLGFLENVGLAYLTMSRTANTLSGGEAQRIRLATQIGSHLQGVLYVLDEPSIGLHQRDNGKLIKTLEHLRDLGNTVIVVEHDEETMRKADYLIEIGPKSGAHGGDLVFAGTFKDMEKSDSETADFLFGRQEIHIPRVRRKKMGEIKIFGAEENNLKNIDVEIPLSCFVGISGVSGSGKSSLISRILVPTLARELNRAKKPSGKYREITGIKENLDKLISIDQSPIGRTPRSNAATYTGVFTDIREVFAATTEARIRGYKASRFSFNVKGGRCEACSGDGLKKIEMHFLPDVYIPCESCHGRKYNDETLEVTYRGKSIFDVLSMTVEEAVEFFENFEKIQQKLRALNEVGLGYIKLGQPAPTLSGGEAQRVKLASELMKKQTGKTVYVLDEPTTGLHFSDVKKLLSVLQKLVDKGNSMIVIEHNLDVLKCCDYIVDIGPEGGEKGGTLVAQGTPEEVAKIKESYTGHFLKEILG